MNDLLIMLEDNARYSTAELAAMLEIPEDEVRARVADYEKRGVICGYKTIVDWQKTDRDYVQARIELKVAPKKDRGFDELASYISRFDEVQSLYLMSGGYDLALTLHGRSFKEIASFVAYRLAPMDSVQSTATHFVLKKYKDKGALLEEETKTDRREFL
jgi:DNA-binding Lrp family transcriptional regulator